MSFHVDVNVCDPIEPAPERRFSEGRPTPDGVTSSTCTGSWAAWRTKQMLQDEAPELIDDLIDSLVEFADPILDGDQGHP